MTKDEKNSENHVHLSKFFAEQFVSQRIDVALFRYFDLIPSRSVASKIIENGFVWFGSKTKKLKPSYRIEENDDFFVDLNEFISEKKAIFEPQPESILLQVIFEDEDVLVIDKPAGLVVHPGAGVFQGTLVNAVLHHCGYTLPSLGEPLRAGIVHRLDRDTSGVMVVAKSQLALTKLSQDFAEHKHLRQYLALCYGVPSPEQGTIETFHGRHPKNRIKFAVVPENIGKKAILQYRVKDTFCNRLMSLVECELMTGRTHQIRVQMTHLGNPLIGDAVYGSPSGAILKEKQIFASLLKLAQRQMLHANVLEFTHPRHLERMRFESPLPADFSALLEEIRRY